MDFSLGVGFMTMNTEQKMIGTGEIAKAMGVTPKTVAKWCDLGYLKFTVLPASKRRRVRLGDARMFAKQHGQPFNYPS